MNEKLKTTLTQKLAALDDEAGRQLLDYVEFLESKYNRSTRDRTAFERIAENVEGTLRGSKLGEATIKGTGDLIGAASGVFQGIVAAGRAVLDELQSTGRDEASGATAAAPPERSEAGGTAAPAAEAAPDGPSGAEGPSQSPEPAKPTAGSNDLTAGVPATEDGDRDLRA